MSMFDINQFLEGTITEANDTKTIPIPQGEYLAVVDEIKVREWQSRSDPSKAGVALDVTWTIEDDSVRQLLGREKVTCKQGVMLDLTDAKTLDLGKGRNVGLGRLREATNLNIPGQPFSFPMLVGRMAKVNVTWRVEGENTYAEIKQVARAS